MDPQDIYPWINSHNNSLMDMNELYARRRMRLEKVLREEFHGKQVDLAARLDRQAGYISRILRDQKKLAEELAREFEAKLGKPDYWLDGVRALPLTDDEAETSPILGFSERELRSIPREELQEIELLIRAKLTRHAAKKSAAA